MVGLVRHALRWLARRRGDRFGVSSEDFALIVVVMLASALVTEWLGVHALFVAFFAGLMMPADAHMDRTVVERIEPVAQALLLPLFFALTGLRTSVQLLDSAALWRATALVVAAAIAGKGIGGAVAARLIGLGWRDACAVGVLLNTRGLIELVVLNIGLDVGILSRSMFSMLVLMALFTTFVAAPLVAWLVGSERPASPEAEVAAAV